MLITEDKKSLCNILCLLKATVVLHNVLIEVGELEKNEWIDHDNFSDIDDAD